MDELEDVIKTSKPNGIIRYSGNQQETKELVKKLHMTLSDCIRDDVSRCSVLLSEDIPELYKRARPVMLKGKFVGADYRESLKNEKVFSEMRDAISDKLSKILEESVNKDVERYCKDVHFRILFKTESVNLYFEKEELWNGLTHVIGLFPPKPIEGVVMLRLADPYGEIGLESAPGEVSIKLDSNMREATLVFRENIEDDISIATCIYKATRDAMYHDRLNMEELFNKEIVNFTGDRRRKYRFKDYKVQYKLDWMHGVGLGETWEELNMNGDISRIIQHINDWKSRER